MSSRRRTFSMKEPVAVVDVGCGCHRGGKLSAFLSSLRLKPRPNSRDEPHRKTKQRRRNRGPKKPWSAAAESVPVVKESSEPYADFRESMVQMIVENDLYAWDELNDLLHRFLSINSPRHHNLILHAFADLWSGVFSPPSPCYWESNY